MKQELGQQRILTCLHTSCCEYFREIGVPVEFAAPAMYTVVSSVIGRRLYYYSKRGFAQLNGFRFLVSGPGGGKSLAIDFVRKVLLQTELKIPLMPSSVTKASLVDELAKDDNRTQMGRDGADRINHSTVLASEYGVLIGQHVHSDFFHTMCELFDGRHYIETRRHLDKPIEIHNPYLNMLAGTQPTHWGIQFPREAWGMGYASRCDFYFADVSESSFQFFEDADPNAASDDHGVPKFIRDVAHDLQCLFERIVPDPAKPNDFGFQVKWSAAGKKAFLEWDREKKVQTAFKDPWLLDYNQRRQFRLWRDAALCCLFRHDTEFVVEQQDFDLAFAIFSPQEDLLVQYLHRISSSADGDIIKSTWAWAMATCARTKRPISYGILKEFLLGKVDGYKVEGLIKHMVDMEALTAITSYTRPDKVIVNLASPMFKPEMDWMKRQQEEG